MRPGCCEHGSRHLRLFEDGGDADRQLLALDALSSHSLRLGMRMEAASPSRLPASLQGHVVFTAAPPPARRPVPFHKVTHGHLLRRSVFPSLYLPRYVVWDTMLNSIFVDRFWACIGELTWTFQIALAMRHVDKELSSKQSGTLWVQATGWLAFFLYVVAEGLSYYNVSTTNNLWCAAEVTTDGLSFITMVPGAIYLTYKQWNHTWNSAKAFTVAQAIGCVLYPLYNFTVVAPMYLKRYSEDQAAHKHYFPFWEGLMDSITTRNVARETSDWSGDMVWMVAYFSIGAWSSIILMFAPRVEKNKQVDMKGPLLFSEAPMPSYEILKHIEP